MDTKIIPFPLSDEQKARINYLFSKGILKYDLGAKRFEKSPVVNVALENN